ncbi:MAG: phage antirepressor KilAC domain-containing protein [Lachnospiraceae bacterium]|nr:phage antirepressor KilAC domain-containing protein [Ruminococcus sp.]MCM1277199.1 phage antirepressor KilAC domain-containing protein [Lachnospiraceae bacterium]
MNEIQIFTNEQFGEIRTIEKDGKILFCAKDIAIALGYKDSVNAIKLHCRWVVKYHLPHPQSPDKQIEMSFIPEGDVYRLITHSKLPAAEQFERWVFDEVLPSIRKHGMYAIDEIIANPDLAIEALIALRDERKKNKELETAIAVQTQQIAEMKPKVSYYDIVLQCHDLLPITEIAKDYGKSAKWLNQTLSEQKIQFKQSGMWLLYQKYAENGYTMSKTIAYKDNDGEDHTKLHTYWTQKGRLFIYDTLKSLGHLPVIEQE